MGFPPGALASSQLTDDFKLPISVVDVIPDDKCANITLGRRVFFNDPLFLSGHQMASQFLVYLLTCRRSMAASAK